MFVSLMVILFSEVVFLLVWVLNVYFVLVVFLVCLLCLALKRYFFCFL